MLPIEEICQNAKDASRQLALAKTVDKNIFLSKLAKWLRMHFESIEETNSLDRKEAISAGLSSAMVDRLTLTRKRIENIAKDLLHVVDLPDPVGEVFEGQILENGLKVQKQRVPLGVLAAIYESRPNVTIDIAALAIKSGNAIVLRGGKETIRTNSILIKGIHEALQATDFDLNCIQFIDEPDREHVEKLLQMHAYVDMLIPRGGAGLHRYCRENSTISVITGGIGVCHLFVDASANIDLAVKVIRNAKVQRPTVCNALDTVLVHKDAAKEFMPKMVEVLSKDGVSFRMDEKALNLVEITGIAAISPVKESDFDTEWLSLVLNVKIVENLDEAIEHITLHSTHHSDGILSESDENAKKFISQVDSAVVYVNSSTRFTDGSQLGLGAEVAISTQRLHARGPMALKELTTYKWIVKGDYSVRK